ncbi:MAG TPA: VOC family protein [Terriglobia bacterium]|nr:VOC family protein [Terriglobia bacterium]
MKTIFAAAMTIGLLAGIRLTSVAAQFPAEVVGVGGYAHIVADLDRAMKFYVDAMGLEMARPVRPFDPTPWAMQAGNTPGASSSAANLRVPGGEMTVELITYRDFDTRAVKPRLEDPGATTLILNVRDAADMRQRLVAAGGREIAAHIIQDPDGFYVRLVENKNIAGPLGGATLGVTVADTAATLKIYRDLMGFRPGPTDANLRTVAPIPGARASTIEWTEFKTPDRQAIHTRLPDPGTTMLLLPVRDAEAAAAALKEGGLEVISAGGKVVTHDNGSRVIIVRDPNNLFLELIQRAPRP